MVRWDTRHLIGILLAMGLSACGGEREEEGEERHEEAEAAEHLSAFELENGIGPVKETIVLGPLDQKLVEQGKAVFEVKCSMCHKMDTTYVGPSLGEVTTRRTPAFIMNMILNPQEMVEKHPVARQLLAERMTFMPNQQLTVADARAVLEYLRTQSREARQPAPKEE